MITKSEIDKLVEKYENIDFIKDDPVRIPNRFSEKKDIEIAGFIASLVAYGRRDVFLKKLDTLFNIAQNEPLNFILNFEPKILGDFNYRFGKPEDFSQIFNIMRDLYSKNSSLEDLFKYGYENQIDDNMFIPITDYFYANAKDNNLQIKHHNDSSESSSSESSSVKRNKNINDKSNNPSLHSKSKDISNSEGKSDHEDKQNKTENKDSNNKYHNQSYYIFLAAQDTQ